MINGHFQHCDGFRRRIMGLKTGKAVNSMPLLTRKDTSGQGVPF
jgi:hypothetical protein